MDTNFCPEWQSEKNRIKNWPRLKWHLGRCQKCSRAFSNLNLQLCATGKSIQIKEDQDPEEWIFHFSSCPQCEQVERQYYFTKMAHLLAKIEERQRRQKE